MYYDGPCRCNEFRGKCYIHLYVEVVFFLYFQPTHQKRSSNSSPNLMHPNHSNIKFSKNKSFNHWCQYSSGWHFSLHNYSPLLVLDRRSAGSSKIPPKDFLPGLCQRCVNEYRGRNFLTSLSITITISTDFIVLLGQAIQVGSHHFPTNKCMLLKKIFKLCRKLYIWPWWVIMCLQALMIDDRDRLEYNINQFHETGAQFPGINQAWEALLFLALLWMSEKCARFEIFWHSSVVLNYLFDLS